jgi:transcriptional regulator of heat shock response
MDIRQAKLLAAIIDQFIDTALPVGSKSLLETKEFRVSSATIRSEMSALEVQGFLEQPHVSAGRVPTVKGYRTYVQQFMNPTAHEKVVRSRFDQLREQYFQHKDRERVYEAVALLANMIPNVSFATVPHRERVYYLGLANAMQQPEFQSNARFASGVVEVLERSLSQLIEKINLTDQVQYFIGDINITPEFESCSLMITKYRIRDQVGAVGILGPMRMDYSYNTVALDMVAGLLRDA